MFLRTPYIIETLLGMYGERGARGGGRCLISNITPRFSTSEGTGRGEKYINPDKKNLSVILSYVPFFV